MAAADGLDGVREGKALHVVIDGSHGYAVFGGKLCGCGVAEAA